MHKTKDSITGKLIMKCGHCDMEVTRNATNYCITLTMKVMAISNKRRSKLTHDFSRRAG